MARITERKNYMAIRGQFDIDLIKVGRSVRGVFVSGSYGGPITSAQARRFAVKMLKLADRAEAVK